MKTVRELIDELEDYGGHLPVVVEGRNGFYYELAVDDKNIPGGGVVIVLAAIGQSMDLADIRED